MTGIKKSTIITIAILAVVVIALWIFSMSSKPGEKPNNLPYRTWTGADEMVTILGENYPYPAYLPADMPLNQAKYTSWYINLSNKKDSVENFEGYNVFYNSSYNIASTSAKDWLEEVLIKCEQKDRAVSNRQYTTITDNRKDPANTNYIYTAQDEEVKTDSLTYYLSAYLTEESSNKFTVEAYYENNGILYSMLFNFIRSENQSEESLDKTIATYKDDAIQFAKDEISKTLQSLTTGATPKEELQK